MREGTGGKATFQCFIAVANDKVEATTPGVARHGGAHVADTKATPNKLS